MRRDRGLIQCGDMKRDPVLVLSALLAALGPLVGNGLYAGPPGDQQDALVALREGLPAVASFALGLELLGLVALTVLVARLAALLVRAAPVAAGVLAVAGAAALAVKLGSAVPVMAAVVLADELDAGTAHLLLTLNDQAFVVTGLLLGVALAAAGAGLLRTTTARWLAWWPLLAGALAVLTAGAGILSPGSYVPVPFLLLLVWMLALGIRSALGTGADTGGGFAREAPTTTMTA
jgi:hypothetical protein